MVASLVPVRYSHVKEPKPATPFNIVVPPADFNAKKADDVDLVKHGYPPRPDGNASPRHQALWERIIERPFRVISPAQLTKNESLRPAQMPAIAVERLNTGGWAGALNTSLPSGWSFSHVGAEWTVPNATIYWSNEVPNGSNQTNAYVGLAGTLTGTPTFPGNYPLVALGTTSNCTVVNGVVEPGSQTALAWFRSYGEVFELNIPVSPGDKVGASIYGTGLGSTPLTTTTFQFWNFTQGLSTSVNWSNAAFEATICQWLVGSQPYLVDENLPSPYPLTSGLVFSDTLAIGISATQTESTEVDLTSATLLNTVLPSGVESVTVELSPESFEIQECCIL